eukprot:4505713-Prymnesium_polylepis.2
MPHTREPRTVRRGVGGGTGCVAMATVGLAICAAHRRERRGGNSKHMIDTPHVGERQRAERA